LKRTFYMPPKRRNS